MKFNSTLILLILAALTLLSCNKNEGSGSTGSGLVKIDSLYASDTVLNVWVPTTITVVASGEGLIYNWEADHGEFNGSGSQIEYLAGTCCTGINTITCTVANTTNSDAKQIKIRILPF
jgi:hypothetical protein